MNHMNAPELAAWLADETREKPLLLDVREAAELAVASVRPDDRFELLASADRGEALSRLAAERASRVLGAGQVPQRMDVAGPAHRHPAPGVFDHADMRVDRTLAVQRHNRARCRV